MDISVLLLLLPLLVTVSSQTFDPNVTVACAVGPTYTFNLTGGSVTGVIFIDGRCAAQDTAVQGTYTFAAGNCTLGGVPPLGTEFRVVVQQFATINLASDLIVKVTCNLNTSTVTKEAGVSATGEDFDSNKTVSVSPTFAIAFKDTSDNTVTTGAVGTDVKIVISIPATEYAVFDFQVQGLTAQAAGGSPVSMITAWCPLFPTIIAKPGNIVNTGGVASLTVPFKLFIPKDSKSNPSLPGTSAASVTYTFTITVCPFPCTSTPTCTGRKRRSPTANNSTSNPIEISATFLVYPPGHKTQSSTVTEKNSEPDDVCLSRTPIIGVLVALSAALVVCLALTAFMFCKLRKPARKGDMPPYSNDGYKE